MIFTEAFILQDLLLDEFGSYGFNDFRGDVLIESFFKKFNFKIFAEVFDKLR